jgi:hypothetical protein
MKKLYLFIIGLLLSSTGLSQSCLPEGIGFNDQAEIDNFQVNYPGCTEIEGNVEIEGDNILNLDGLSVLTSIGGQLYITNNDLLGNIIGLASLTSVGGSLLISSNPNLASLGGLESLSVVSGDVFISSNSVLADISAIGNINPENVAELWITSNVSLATCDNPFICNYLSNPAGTVNIKSNAPGCNNPPEIADECGIVLGCLPNGNYNFFTQADIDNFQFNYPGCIELSGEVTINGNDIVSLSGLDMVNSVNGSLKVFNNPQMTSLAGLGSIILINGPLSIIGNSILNDISALSYIDTSSISFLGITNNPLLSECDIVAVCDYLSGPYGSSHHNIAGNDDGCKNRDEVLQACLAGVGEIMDDKDQVRISPNPSSTQITIETPGTTSKFQLSIFNLNSQELIRRQITEPTTVIDIGDLPGGVYFVRMRGERSVGVEKFIKID